MKKLEDGFFSISGAAVDAAGKLYFVDHHNQRIYSWSEKEGLAIERDNPLDPVNLAFDKSGNLLVLSSAGPESTVYTFRPGSSAEELTVLKPQPAQPHANASVILPAELVEQRRVQRPARSGYDAVHDAGRDVRGGCDHAKSARVRLGGWQCFFARRPRLSARPRDGYLRLALQRQPRHLRFPHRRAGPARLCQQRVGRHHL